MRRRHSQIDETHRCVLRYRKTFGTITREGEYGGVIAKGLGIYAEALFARAPNFLSRVDAAQTVSAGYAGVSNRMLLACGLVDALCADRTRLGRPPL